MLIDHIMRPSVRINTQFGGNGLGSTLRLLGRLRWNDEVVLLEAGTNGPGDLARATKSFKPDISLVTLVAIEHYGPFRRIQEITLEKSEIVRALPANGLAILNYDDPNVRSMGDFTSARVVYFGQTGGKYHVVNVSTSSKGNVSICVACGKDEFQFETALLGKQNWLAVSAAVAFALEYGIPYAQIAERVATFKPMFTRMSYHETSGGVTYILDCAKAPYHSIELPMRMLGDIKAERKRFVLGHISDYAGNPLRKYREAYAAALAVADQVILVGTAARRVKPLQDDLDSGKVVRFDALEKVAGYLNCTGRDGDIVLVKSSRNLHLERLYLSKVEKVECWIDECGKKVGCSECGLFRVPYAQHRRTKHTMKKKASAGNEPM